MSQQNVRGATTKPTAASAQLTTNQIFELASYVEMYGIDTGELFMPDLPTGCEHFTASMDGSPDSITVWMLNGWPVAACDDLCMVNWKITGWFLSVDA